MEFLDKISAFLDAAFASADIIAVVISFVLGFVGRKWRDGIRAAGGVVGKIGGLLVKLSEFVLRVVPALPAEQAPAQQPPAPPAA